MKHKSLVVFDIETVPDRKYHAANQFPPPLFHQVIAIAFLEADIVRSGKVETYRIRDLRAGGERSYSEEQLLLAFLQYLERIRPRIVSYNGRAFDVPVIKYRSMSYQITASLLYEPDYSYRYNVESHCDLLELLTDFGATTRMKLVDICRVFNLPAKLGMDGAKVASHFQSDDIDTIRNYCEIDVVSTYLVYLRSALSRGIITIEGFESASEDLKCYLSKNKEERRHLGKFLREWETLSLESSRGEKVHPG